jgi:ubiquinone/menaquinone biosynthesis C-methylase UbiE
MQMLSVEEFYAGVDAFVRRVDPTWDEESWATQVEAEKEILGRVLGRGDGRTVLDCSCGAGRQAVPLAQLGWRATASDVTATSLDVARGRAREAGVSIAFQLCDMRELESCFTSTFDRVISCYALDNITVDDGIRRAIRGMFAVLKPGGRCYIRLTDFDNIMADKPRYEFREERRLPHGRVIRLQDWIYESETHAVCVYVYLHEDNRRPGYAWTTDIFAFRRRALRKTELAAFLQAAGFQQLEFLPQPSPWHPYEVVAVRPSCQNEG